MQFKIFTENPRDETYQNDMRMFTSYRPPHDGKHKQACTYTASDCVCKLCSDYAGKNKCKSAECICFDERLEAGCVTYPELVTRLQSSIQYNPLNIRFKKLLQANWSFFYDQHSQKVWQTVSKEVDAYYNAFAAALYLILCDEFLRERSRPCIKYSSINFDDMDIRGIGLKSYPVYLAAKGIYNYDDRIAPDEMADSELICDKSFQLIVNAYLIKRYGPEILNYKYDVPSILFNI